MTESVLAPPAAPQRVRARENGKFVKKASTSPLADAQPKPVAVAQEPEADDGKPKRRSFGIRRSKLSYKLRDGFVRRWVNDAPGRIEDALECGYTHVEEKGKPVSRPVGKTEQGAGLTAFLMEVPQEFYDEDFAKKQEMLDETDQQIYRGKHNEQAGDKRYVPEGSISMTVQKGPGAERRPGR